MKLTKNAQTLVRIILALALFIPLTVSFFVIDLPVYVSLPLFLAAYALIGYDVVIKAVKSVIRLSALDENLLMVIATVGAFIVGEYSEAVAVMLFYQIGELFQRYAVGKSRNSIAQLMQLRPDTVTVIRDGEEVEIFTEEAIKGDIMLVRAGERIALDGVVVSGSSTLNTAALTGESLPVTVNVGSEILSGSLNESGLISVEISKEYSESTVTRILEMVENASDKKAKTERFISRFAAFYTPIVVILAVILAIVPSLITHRWQTWIYRALTFLVVSCPCALVISVPLSFFGAIGGAGKAGILFKGGNCLETLAKANVALLDKTGTVTKGEFNIIEVVAENRDETLRLAAIAESRSTHPIARSILSQVSVDNTGYEITESAGKGVIARFDGDIIIAGNARFMKENDIIISEVDTHNSVVYVAHNGEFVGAIIIGDSVKSDSAAAISELKAMGVTPVMLSGDNERAARAVASSVGIAEVHARLLPQDKMRMVEQYCERDKVIFVGDGINDAPSIMRADIGVAMGGVGSDSAIESADVVLMYDTLSSLPRAKRIAKKAIAIVKQNIVFALAVKAAVLALSAVGVANMWLAIFADVGVAVLAILNSMRMLKAPK